MGNRKRKAASKTKPPPAKVQKLTMAETVDETKSNNIETERKTIENGGTAAFSDQQSPSPKKAKSKVKDGVLANTITEPPILKEKKISGPEYECGTLVLCGSTNWDMTGRKIVVPKSDVRKILLGPHRLDALAGIRVRLAVSGCVACHSIIVTENGCAMSWGRNNKGQLGHGDTDRRDVPTLIKGLKDWNVVDAAVGHAHTLVLTDQGEVFGFGNNDAGQCGVGVRVTITDVPKRISYQGPLITKVACGAEFSVILDTEGYIHAFGSPECGQLGNNTDGKYFITASKLVLDYVLAPKRIITFLDKSNKVEGLPVEDVRITSIACGTHHTIAMDTKKRCYTWGCGGYGRLGHNNSKDEMVPRLVKFFDGLQRGVGSVHAGSTCSLVINKYGTLFFWGQNNSRTGATMYPKPMIDMGGWKVKRAACSYSSIVVFADESVLSWGVGLTYGELGYGDKGPKTSSKPKIVELLEKFYVHSISCGHGHTLFVIRDETKAERDNIGKLPLFSP